jgi:Flp pilus assembly protein TadB
MTDPLTDLKAEYAALVARYEDDPAWQARVRQFGDEMDVEEAARRKPDGRLALAAVICCSACAGFAAWSGVAHYRWLPWLVLGCAVITWTMTSCWLRSLYRSGRI